MKSSLAALLVAVLCLLYTRGASASHKMWLLKNGSAECSFAIPSKTDTAVNGRLTNSSSGARTATCPVALSARYGSSTYAVFQPPRWADAGSAIVYGSTPSSSATLSCYSTMSTSNGSLHFGQTISKSGSTGLKRLDLAYRGSWGTGSTLEANDTQTAVTMDFICTLPASGGTIFGYKVKICQYTRDCDSDNDDPEGDVGGGDAYNSVQTSGIECSPTQTTYTADILRNVHGVTNSNSTAHRAVFCPVAPPSDDSAEGPRLVKFTVARFSGGSSNSTCVQDATCPSCNLKWWDRSGVLHAGNTFKIKGTGHLQQEDLPALNIDKEVQVGVWCVLPPGVTLNGVTSHMSVSDVIGGQ